ncbi:hypothetical protein CsSME_00006315 [Camellia sinensis var. sinensis]
MPEMGSRGRKMLMIQSGLGLWGRQWVEGGELVRPPKNQYSTEYALTQNLLAGSSLGESLGVPYKLTLV